ncbi:MAG TPA: hypothetical protein DFR83_26845 [Deltaproteobacteria bacterium]|nr:hypothetical protein [Deltaproteobacteria bacterium]
MPLLSHRVSFPERFASHRRMPAHAAGILAVALSVACADEKDSASPTAGNSASIDSGAGDDGAGAGDADGGGSTAAGSGGASGAGSDGSSSDGGDAGSGSDDGGGSSDDSGSDDAGSDDSGSDGSGSDGSGSGGSGSGGSGSGSGSSGSGSGGSGSSGSGGSGSGGSGSGGTVISVPAVGVPTDLPSSGTSGTVVTSTGTAASGTITDVDFLIDLDHSCTQDLVAVLESPSGTAVTVFDMAAYPVCSSDMENTVLDDEASVLITSGSTPFTGSYLPSAPLSAFDGEDAAGVWTLTIEDRVRGDSGELQSWSLDITVL